MVAFIVIWKEKISSFEISCEYFLLRWNKRLLLLNIWYLKLIKSPGHLLEKYGKISPKKFPDDKALMTRAFLDDETLNDE